MTQTIFQILSQNERVIVWSNEETGVLYTWNQSITLQCWARVTVGDCDSACGAEWEEVSIRTLAHDPRDFKGAREAAKRWDVDGVADDR